ncbi:beta-ketoacyl-ACP synthase [Arenimonas sp.]|uniref:beta-ketoacyl-ACP synthase n=1 Tax=Arenimonas sp. TaxID=1872635 RepID=UPI0039E2EAB9
MSAFFLNDLGVVCALGQGKRPMADALFSEGAPGGLTVTDQFSPARALHVGRVQFELPSLEALPIEMRGHNNALLEVALTEIRPGVKAALDRYGAHRIAVVIGTSTSGVGESEIAQRSYEHDARWPRDFHYAQQEMGTPAHFVASRLGATGPAHVISTACSSSTKALAAAARLLAADMADAVVVGGADSLCAFTIAGFSALESVSAARCNPFSANRRGINIGEGAALFLMTREPGPVRLAGWGESSDAHHMSAPEPSGRGAKTAIEAALRRAAIGCDQVDYVNLHGTATPQNDAMESRVMAEIFPEGVACSSTKPLTGHTLGAAGAIEAAICWLTMQGEAAHRLPPHWWDGVVDADLPALRLVTPGDRFGRAPAYLLSQNFAFGGSNAAIVLGAG